MIPRFGSAQKLAKLAIVAAFCALALTARASADQPYSSWFKYGSELDANDADFGKFAVWQDANSNGVAEAGEVTSLADAGISSIGLVSDGVA